MTSTDTISPNTATTAPAAETDTTKPARFPLMRRVLTSPKGIAGLILMLVIVAMAALAPILFPLGPWAMVGRPYIWPASGATLMGTDVLGRDMTAAMFWGAQISLLVGLVSAGISLVIGIAVGSAAGYYGGRVDAILMRFTDAVAVTVGRTLRRDTLSTQAVARRRGRGWPPRLPAFRWVKEYV